MPVYEFECEDCGVFEAFRPLDRRDDPLPCPDCDRTASRLVSAPNLAVLSAANRKAFAINEKSRHEPRVGLKHACSSSCGCTRSRSEARTRAGSPSKKPPAGERGLKAARNRSARPWMLGH
ncbi:MAG: FmdB family zinc ribbon protein [Limisphaerales bacterium]